MKLLPVFFVVALALLGQSQTGAANTKGQCSPATTGNNNSFTITCGIGQEQGRKMLEILNQILANQLDPDAVMKKLEEIGKDVKQIRDNQGWAQLTTEQQRAITIAAALSPHRKFSVRIPNPEPDTQSLGRAIATALRADPALWEGTVQTMMVVYSPDSEPPLGIELVVGEADPTSQAVLNVFSNIFGTTAVRGILNKDAPKDQLAISVLWKPR